jgi:hypothetical protein
MRLGLNAHFFIVSAVPEPLLFEHSDPSFESGDLIGEIMVGLFEMQSFAVKSFFVLMNIFREDPGKLILEVGHRVMGQQPLGVRGDGPSILGHCDHLLLGVLLVLLLVFVLVLEWFRMPLDGVLGTLRTHWHISYYPISYMNTIATAISHMPYPISHINHPYFGGTPLLTACSNSSYEM